MKPDDVLLRLKEIKDWNESVRYNRMNTFIGTRGANDQMDWLISQIETLIAEKAKLVDALEDIRKGPWNGCSGCNRMEMAHEALASVGTEAE